MKTNFDSKQQLTGPANALTTRRLERIKDRPPQSLQSAPNGESDAAPASHALFVIPTRRGDSFTASIRGHMLELADPTDHRLAPSPDDLLIASIASDLAWSARRFLRGRRLPDDVSVSARWQTAEGLPSLADITLTVTVSTRAKAVSGALAAACANSLGARFLAEPIVHISLEGGNR
jgi:DsbC/DsbD-like thiol-disulfide interchange protein